ncbi:MAG: Abi-alpha family protein [Chitinophagales bacterium]
MAININLPNIPKELLSEIYKDSARPGVQQIGKALGNILSIVNTVSIPFKLANQKANIWFENNLEKYREKMSYIGLENIQPVLPEIAVPIVEKMAYTTCSELGEMFANLLKNASTKGGMDKAHPNFVNIISSISKDEAIILEDFYKNPLPIPALFLKVTRLDKTWNTPIMCFTHYDSDTRLDYPNNNEFYMNNLENLGLIYRSQGTLADTDYKKLEVKFQRKIKPIKENKGEKYGMYRNHIGVAPFGKLFLKAVFE